MRIPRFYCPIALNVNSSVNLPENTFRHAIQVLRLNIGEALIVFNGQGGEYCRAIPLIYYTPLFHTWQTLYTYKP